jgi:hypothetical protein
VSWYFWWRKRQVPPKRRFLQEPHGVTTQKTPFFIYSTSLESNIHSLASPWNTSQISANCFSALYPERFEHIKLNFSIFFKIIFTLIFSLDFHPTSQYLQCWLSQNYLKAELLDSGGPKPMLTARKHIYYGNIFIRYVSFNGQAVAQLVESLSYRPEGRGFDSRYHRILNWLKFSWPIFWNLAPSSSFVNRRFGGRHHLHLTQPPATWWFLDLPIFKPEDGSESFLRNVGSFTDYTALYLTV